jgi:hypothetical protein
VREGVVVVGRVKEIVRFLVGKGYRGDSVRKDAGLYTFCLWSFITGQDAEITLGHTADPNDEYGT